MTAVHRLLRVQTHGFQRLPWREAMGQTMEREPQEFPEMLWVTEGSMGRPVSLTTLHCFCSSAELLCFLMEIPILMQLASEDGDAASEDQEKFQSYWQRCARRRLNGGVRLDEAIMSLAEQWRGIGGYRSPRFLRVVYAQEALVTHVRQFLRGERGFGATVKALSRVVPCDVFSFEVANWKELLHGDEHEHVRAAFAERHDVPSSRGRTIITPEHHEAFITFLRERTDEWMCAHG